MLKKIMIASILATVSSFAAWDLQPVPENHFNQARIGTIYNTFEHEGDDYSSLDFYAGLRTTIVPNLEIAFNIPYRAFTHINEKDQKMDGIGNIGFSTRYQFIPTMNAFFDVSLPVGDKSYLEDDDWRFGIGLQFSTQINWLLNIGAQVEYVQATEGEDSEAPLYANALAKLVFTIMPEFTPYIGTFVDFNLGTFADHDYQYSHGGGDIYIAPFVGAVYEINEAVSVDGSLFFGKFVNIDDSPKVFITANLAFLFNF